MPIIPLTDEELKAVAGDPALVGKLTSEERRRLSKLQAIEKGGPDWGVAPTLGGMVGGLAGTVLGGPPGAVAGAAVGGGLGKAAQLYMQGETGAESPLNLGDAALGTGVEAAKQGLIELPGALVSFFGNRASRRLMQSALKPSNATMREGATQGVRTKGDVAERVLREPRILVSQGSLEKIQGQIDEINDSIRQVLTTSGAGLEVPLQRATKPLADVAQRAVTQANPTKDLETVNRAYDEFMAHPLGREGFVPVATAQDMKTGTYRAIRGKYGELGSFETEAQKALARGLKDEVAHVVPEVAAKNMRESELIFIEKAVGAALNRAGNTDPIGFANAAPASKRFWLALADRSPLLKSALARVVRAGAPVIGVMGPAAARGGLLATMPDER